MTRRTIVFVIAAALVVGLVSTGSAVAPPEDTPATSEEAEPRLGVIDGASDFTMHGTAWVPERRYKFKKWQPVGWGVKVRAKEATDQWVHIPIPFPTYIDDEAQRIALVEFCARSSNGAATKPIRMDLWGDKQFIKTVPISWPADNDYHCFTHVLSPSIWKPTLGVSVLLRFANSTDRITLYKAWAQVKP